MQKLHNNATTTEHLRRQIQRTKLPVTTFCSQHGITRATFYKWRNRKTTKDSSSRPKNTSAKLTPEDELLICNIYQQTGASAKYVQEIFQHRKDVSISTIYRAIRKHYTRPKREINKFESTQLGFVHIDVTYLPMINETKYYLYVAIERNSRYMYYKVFENKEAKSTIVFLQNCINYLPFKVHTILSDNGREFRSRKVQLFAENARISWRFTKPGNPQTNGMVERVNKTIKRECIKNEKFSSVQEMIFSLENYLEFYNTKRYHSSCYKYYRVRTPIDVIKKIAPNIWI